MPEQLWFTKILNHAFAGLATSFLRSLHIEPKYPQAPITNAFAMELLVFVFLIALFTMVRSRLSVDRRLSSLSVRHRLQLQRGH